MNYYLDTEFCEGPQKKRIFGIPYGSTKPTIDLISIGIVSEDNREYYAISKEFNIKEAWNRWQQRTGCGDYNNINPRNYWLRENVLKPIFDELIERERAYIYKASQRNVYFSSKVKDKFTYRRFKYLINKYGKTNKEIANEIKEFVKPQPTGNMLTSNPPQIEYDNSPIQFYAYFCSYDWVVFCWIFGKMIDLPDGFPMYCNDIKQILDEKQLFQINKYEGKTRLEAWLQDIKTLTCYPVNKNPHHALSDAKFDKDLHKFLKQL